MVGFLPPARAPGSRRSGVALHGPLGPRFTMSDQPAQPGLSALSKSFEPTAIEAQWGPEWERRGYGRAGARGTDDGKEPLDIPRFLHRQNNQ